VKEIALLVTLIILCEGIAQAIGCRPSDSGPRLVGQRGLCGQRDGQSQHEPTNEVFVLEMVLAALRTGLSVPGSLRAVGNALRDGRSGVGGALTSVADLLDSGVEWSWAWDSVGVVAGGRSEAARALRGALEASWVHGVSPVPRLRSVIKQRLDSQESEAAQLGAKAMVKVLLPTGLCFLPAFILIGIVPSIASFIG
jgi:hypothetical protein